jgi:hypothetical protein
MHPRPKQRESQLAWRIIMSAMPKLFLALALGLMQCLAIAAQEKTTKVTLNSEVRAPRVPVPESAEGASTFGLSLAVNDKGEGKGKLTLDPNPYKFDEFGRSGEAATKKASIDLECSIKFVKKGTFRLGPNPPLEEERFLYEIQGKKITSRLFLVTASPLKKVGAEPFDHYAWLLVKDDKGNVTHLIRMPPAPRPDISPCHPGCFPVGTLVQTPQGTRPIDTIRAGDMVTIVRADGESEPGKVKSVFITQNRLLKLQTDAGDLITTETQPLVLAAGGIKGAGELKAGDKIFRWQDGKRQVAQVVAVTTTERVEKVFNLILGDSEVFIAGGFLARSKPPGLVAAPTPTQQLSVPAPAGARK